VREIGIVVEMLEDDEDLQERVLTVHHACAQTITETTAFKIVENQLGVAQILMANVVVRTPTP
jgi:hypothetical protein